LSFPIRVFLIFHFFNRESMTKSYIIRITILIICRLWQRIVGVDTSTILSYVNIKFLILDWWVHLPPDLLYSLNLYEILSCSILQVYTISNHSFNKEIILLSYLLIIFSFYFYHLKLYVYTTVISMIYSVCTTWVIHATRVKCEVSKYNVELPFYL